MKSKVLYCLVIIFASLTEYSVSLKYRHIIDCHFYSLGDDYGDDNATFICAESEGSVFYDDTFKCSNYKRTTDYRWTGTIDFQNCHFSATQIIFDKFKSLRKLIISDMEMETLQSKPFKGTNNLTYLDASRNRLSEIPAMLFVNADKLSNVDFSDNLIKTVGPLALLDAHSLITLDLSKNVLTGFDEQAFKDLSNLQVLNLSHNKINALDLRNLPAINLLTLDVSSNNLTILMEHTFDQAVNLKQLNLSFNPVGNLKVETFAYLSNLEYLNLKKTNISSIRMGTFSHQHKLISLDLSENILKELDFDLFLPVLNDLRSLYLEKNQLLNLPGFRNSLFPQLNLLNIKNNRFNCSYLQRFMKSVEWINIKLPVDPKSIDPQEVNIRGINCEVTVQSEEVGDRTHNYQNKMLTDYLFEINSKLGQQSNANNADIYLICICVLMTMFLIIFLLMNRDRIYKKNKTSPNVKQPSYTNQPQIVELL